MRKRLREFWWFLLRGPERLSMAWNRITTLETANSSLVNQVQALQSDLAAVMSELNALRNAVPVAAAIPRERVRVLRNFREFRAAVEGAPQPIPIERTS